MDYCRDRPHPPSPCLARAVCLAMAIRTAVAKAQHLPHGPIWDGLVTALWLIAPVTPLRPAAAATAGLPITLHKAGSKGCCRQKKVARRPVGIGVQEFVGALAFSSQGGPPRLRGQGEGQPAMLVSMWVSSSAAFPCLPAHKRPCPACF